MKTKKIAGFLIFIYSVVLSAQTPTGISPYGEKIPLIAEGNNGITASAGTIQLGGSLTKPTTIVTSPDNTLAISNLTVSGSASDKPIVAGTDGILKTGSFPPINITPSDRGTVLAINGKLEVAQEITALMNGNFTVSAGGAIAIGKLTTVLIDNNNLFSSSATDNSFKVVVDGVYLIHMNMPILTADGCVIGVWCNTDGNWVARINYPGYLAKSILTLITAISLSASKTYSFRVGLLPTGTIEAINTTTSEGSGPTGFVSLKRLK
ncbi:hypothetical protein ACFFLS_10410 [Flavobacterium procerum]|uniref:C1q domain-containing protein n=1 Tax=Flavobacterium procerum TaxID=1455569 RepID=A0ABV6BPS6_9FLAO